MQFLTACILNCSSYDGFLEITLKKKNLFPVLSIVLFNLPGLVGVPFPLFCEGGFWRYQ